LLTIYKSKDYEKLKYHPAVKFRNIEAHVLRRIQLNLDDTADASKDTESDSEDEGDGDGEDNNIEEASRKIAFQVDSDIDIDSRALRDMISLDPVIVQPVSSLLMESRAPGTSGMAPDWNW